MRLAILASGKGSNMRAIQEGISRGLVQAQVALVLSNKPDAPVLDSARAAGIPVWAEPHAAFSSREDFDRAMLRAMKDAGIEAVVLAGYMRLLSPDFIRAYSGKIVNIHPALLPAFAGARGVADTLEYGAKFAGCTVHFVTEEMDAGPIIIQAALPMHAGESEDVLHARIQRLEHRIYPQAVAWLAGDRLRLHGRTVRLLPPDCGCGCSSSLEGTGPVTALINPPLEEGF